MENLKAPLNKKGRKLENLSKSQRFYSEFNSDQSSSSSSSSSDEDGGAFNFDIKRNQNSKFYDNNLNKHTKSENASNHSLSVREKMSSETTNIILPVSPGLSANQDLKDKALDIIYQKKIKELKSKIVLMYLTNAYH